MKGLFLASGKQQIDNHTFADHASPNCHSNELYKGIMDDDSNGVFSGKIMVRKDAQKTNAYQMNKNIILSQKALVNSKPQLEIFADDVKCSHGATTGQLDNEQLFYLKARGIGEKEGKKLLLYAFANEIIEDVNIKELSGYLENKLSEKLESK
jgi:Fe-S cluster assembly protein SufD